MVANAGLEVETVLQPENGDWKRFGFDLCILDDEKLQNNLQSEHEEYRIIQDSKLKISVR